MINQDIPEDVICCNIFSRLPFKLVTCLKVVSKDCCRRLTGTEFATKQATLCPSCPALIHIGPDNKSYRCSLDVLSSTPSIVGVPSSKLDFLGCHLDNGRFDILASTNGLLCIRYKPYYDGPLTPPPTILLANPATQQSQPIPGAANHLDMTSVVGLVFDPLDDPQEKTHKFMIVKAFPLSTINDTLVKVNFISFSSDTGQWVMSSNMIIANMKEVICQKVVYASGVLYWDYQEDLLWFDVERNEVGSIKMPWKMQGFNVHEERHSIDVSSNGLLMCTTTNKDGLAIYQLVRIVNYHWELKHTKGWKSIMEMYCDEFQFCHSMKLRNGCQNKFYERWFVRPLGLEGGRWVYIGVRQKWKTRDKVLRYDMDTGKVENTGKELGNAFAMKCAFGYRNSMATLPPIVMSGSQDGNCDGKSGD
ncbi:uncharacterized protein LOC8079865 [Sorghum bicolor]|uniref:F-box domain-containing protein n=1 Tax=Sorghum bicolor TaxID=4558 RepID=A0A1Z5R4T9_SORBI|nr:uncharacterized protein LOC8079865 [Sorghum bicolor]OQU78798.1 hypothetical protein SORBI_3008G050300 [Sorghum bicolor]|eukprot:XP_002441882.2 uncharacterized protein LOC8079865 [Sorghum bicolor]